MMAAGVNEALPVQLKRPRGRPRGSGAKPPAMQPAAPAPRAPQAWPDGTAQCMLRDLPHHELAVVEAALAILAKRVAEPAALIDGTWVAQEYVRLALAGLEREVFGVLFLDAQHRVIGWEVLFHGTLTQAHVYPREIVRESLRRNAAAVVLAHNHPSGHAEPSNADKRLTAVVKEVLSTVDVKVLDHLVVAWPNVYSFCENGLI